jgi:predicted dienelactone hydrolase
MLWYPADKGGETVLVGDNPAFRGTAARQDAPPAEGRFPLILLSHGSGGNAANLGWIASRLAEDGFVVAAPNHPGSTSGDASQAATIRIWNRPADLSAVLTTLEADPTLQGWVDATKVGVLGFSLGGYTALAVAGARVEAAAYARYCDWNTVADDPMSDCAWFAQGGVDVRQVDATQFGRSNLDARIASVVVVDPGLVHAFAPASLAGIGVPVHIINLGHPDRLPPAVAAAPTAAAIPGATYEFVPDAVHFSFLGLCKPEGPALIEEEGEPPICNDGGGRSRADIHAQLARMIAAAFHRALR